MAKNPNQNANLIAEGDANLNALLENVHLGNVEVIEESAGEGKPKKFKVRGEFARCDEATANKRVYPKTLWEREIKRLGKGLTERKVLGELDHPHDGRTSLHRVSHIVTNLSVKEGILEGEAEILDTEAGRNLQALLKGGAKIGVSSRGFGTVKTNESGEDIVQEDYKLVTFDFVADPADGNAYPTVFIESKQIPVTLKNITADMIKAENPGLIESITAERVTEKELELAQKWADKLEAEKAEAATKARASVKEELAREVLSTVSRAKADISEKVRQELLNDPEIAGAKIALEGVKKALLPYILPEDTATLLKQQEAEATKQIESLQNEVAELKLQVASLSEDNEKLTNVAKEVGYRFFLEREISGNPDADVIRKLVGDVKVFSNVEEVKTKIDAIKADLTAKREESARAAAAAALEARRAEEARRAAEEAQLAEERKIEEMLEGIERKWAAKAAKLEAALQESISTNEELAIRLQNERKLTNHPKASKIRSMMENANVSSVEDFDNLLENVREPARDEDEMERVRARIRQKTRGGFGSKAVDEEKVSSPRNTLHEDWNGTGLDLGTLKSLAGIPNK